MAQSIVPANDSLPNNEVTAPRRAKESPVNIQKLMKQAQKMQNKMQQELGELEVEASTGGGMVSVKMSGHKQLLGVKIEPDVLDPEDPEMLQDLIVAAVNEATRKVDEVVQEQMGAMTGGMGLPGMF